MISQNATEIVARRVAEVIGAKWDGDKPMLTLKLGPHEIVDMPVPDMTEALRMYPMRSRVYLTMSMGDIR